MTPRKHLFAMFLFFTTSFPSTSAGQGVLTDSIKLDAVDFGIEQGYFGKHEKRDDNLKRVYLFEISDEQPLGHSSNGIYLFTITTSHTERFILILNKNSRRFYKLANLQQVLSDTCRFFSDNDVSNDKIIKYLEGISNTYRYNLSLK